MCVALGIPTNVDQRRRRQPRMPLRTAAAVTLVALATALGASAPVAHTAPALSDEGAVWTMLTNGNAVRTVALDAPADAVWAGGDGGLLRWDLGTGTYAKYMMADGLSDTAVRTVRVDPRTGDKWIGTQGGLDRLAPDGTWRHDLPGQWIHAIGFDPDGSTWVGSAYDGLYHLTVDGAWRQYTMLDGLPANDVDEIAIDQRSGELWVVTVRGVAALQPNDRFAVTMLPGEDVRAVMLDPRDGTLWVGSQFQGLFHFERNGRLLAQYHPFNSGLPSITVFRTAVDPADGALWVTTNDGVARMTADEHWTVMNHVSSGLSCDQVPDMVLDPAGGDVWFAVESAGRAPASCTPGLSRRMRDGQWSTWRTADPFTHGNPLGMDLNPSDGSLWTAGNIVERRSPAGDVRTWGSAEGLPGESAAEVAVHWATGDAWAIVYLQGVAVIRADGRVEAFTNAGSPLGGTGEIAALAINQATGDVWIGHVVQGITRRTPDGRWRHYRIPGVPPTAIPDGMDVDERTGDVWFTIPYNRYFAPAQGAFRLTPDGTFTRFTQASTAGALATDDVREVAVHPTTGEVWFTTGDGIAVLRPDGTWRDDSWLRVLDGLAVRTVFLDPPTDEAWFGTEADGVWRLAPDGAWTHYTTADGLASNFVGEIRVDPRSRAVWIRTASGVHRLGPAETADTCATARLAAIGQTVSSRLTGPSAVDIYRLEVREPFGRLALTLPDPEDRLTIDLFRTCDGNIGAGRGRHIGAGRGRHIGGEQRLVYDVGTQTGTYYIAVSARDDGGAFPRDYALGIGFVPVDPLARRTLILTHAPRMQALFGLAVDAPELVAWRGALAALAAHPAVAGLVIDNVQTGTSPDMATAYASWLAQPADPGRAAAVTTALRNWVWAQRVSLPALKYVVVAGDDRVIPFARVGIVPERRGADGWATEDEYLAGSGIDPGSSVGSALAVDLTLTDDVLAATAALPWGAQGQSLPVPELAVGRLVERPADMTAAIDTFLAGDGVVPVSRTLVAGYDFMADAARAVDGRLAAAGIAAAARTRLFDADLTVDALRTALLGDAHGLAFLAAHADHSAYTVPGGAIDAAAVRAAAAGNGAGIVLSLACHAGLNVPGTEHARSPDLPEAWQSRGTALIGATGWAYGLDGLLAYNEALMADTARLLVDGGGAAVGDALVAAKRRYLLEHEVDHLHAKAVVGTVLYGLPMARARLPVEAAGPSAAEHRGAAEAGVDTVDIQVANAGAGQPGRMAGTGTRPAIHRPSSNGPMARQPARLTRLTQAGPERWYRTSRYRLSDVGLSRVSTASGDYFTFSGQPPRADAGMPVQPRFRAALGEVAFDDVVLSPRGVVMTAGQYHDVAGFKPLVPIAGVMGRIAPRARVAQPAPSADSWTPSVPAVLRRLPQPAAGGTLVGEGEAALLLISAGQYQASTATERLLDDVTLDEYYSASHDQDGPFVRSVRWAPGGGVLTVVAVDGQGAVERVVAVHVADGASWASVELALSSIGSWTGAVPEGRPYIVFAVDAAGNVTTVDAQGRIDRPCASCGRPVQPIYLPVAERAP